MYNQRILFTIMFAIHYRVTYAEITIRYYCAISKSRKEHKHNACDAIYVYVNILVSTNTPFIVTPISSLISIMSFLPFQILHLYCCRAWCAGMQGSGAWLLIWGESPPPSWQVRVFHTSLVDTWIVPIQMTIPRRSSQARKRTSKNTTLWKDWECKLWTLSQMHVNGRKKKISASLSVPLYLCTSMLLQYRFLCLDL